MRRIALEQNLAAEAATVRDEGTCLSLLGLRERTVEHREGGFKVTSAPFDRGKLHIIRCCKEGNALLTAIRNTATHLVPTGFGSVGGSDRPAMSHRREQ